MAAVRQGSAADSRPLVWGSVPKAGRRDSGEMATHRLISHCLLSTFPRPQSSGNNVLLSDFPSVEGNPSQAAPHHPLRDGAGPGRQPC